MPIEFLLLKEKASSSFSWGNINTLKGHSHEKVDKSRNGILKLFLIGPLIPIILQW
jgi:hypothetical protein